VGDEWITRPAIASLHAEARVSSPQVSQLLAGEVVRVLAVNGEWVHVRAEDDYEGWTHRGTIDVLDDARRAARLAARISLGCTVCEPGTGRRRALPLGALVMPDESVIGGEAVARTELERRFPRQARAVAVSARELYAGAPYLWGGVTPWGADCSGLVQRVFALHGVALPRDAWQQAACGIEVSEPVDTLRAGDLLYFSDRADGCVTHVGVSLGDARLAHCALGRGGHAVEQLTAVDDPYVRALVRRFVVARRLLDR
jgi:hypothetical protein